MVLRVRQRRGPSGPLNRLLESSATVVTYREGETQDLEGAFPTWEDALIEAKKASGFATIDVDGSIAQPIIRASCDVESRVSVRTTAGYFLDIPEGVSVLNSPGGCGEAGFLGFRAVGGAGDPILIYDANFTAGLIPIFEWCTFSQSGGSTRQWIRTNPLASSTLITFDQCVLSNDSIVVPSGDMIAEVIGEAASVGDAFVNSGSAADLFVDFYNSPSAGDYDPASYTNWTGAGSVVIARFTSSDGQLNGSNVVGLTTSDALNTLANIQFVASEQGGADGLGLSAASPLSAAGAGQALSPLIAATGLLYHWALPASAARGSVFPVAPPLGATAVTVTIHWEADNIGATGNFELVGLSRDGTYGSLQTVAVSSVVSITPVDTELLSSLSLATLGLTAGEQGFIEFGRSSGNNIVRIVSILLEWE